MLCKENDFLKLCCWSYLFYHYYMLNLFQEPVSKPPQEVCKYPSHKDELKYVDELIQKQANEITQLKNELRTVRCEHREEVTEMERQMTLKERECVHKISGLEAELRNAEDRYDTQVTRADNELRREKTCLRGFRPGPTQTGLYSHRRWLGA